MQDVFYAAVAVLFVSCTSYYARAAGRRKMLWHACENAWRSRPALLAYFATGIVNSAPLAMLSGQRCMMLL